MRIIYSKNFLKEASKLTSEIQEHLDVCLRIISKDPFYPTLHTKKLKGELKNMLSFRVTRDFRVIFTFIDLKTIQLLTIGNRKDIYK